MDVSTVRFLLTPAGQRLLDEVTTSYESEDELTVATRFRPTYDADHVAAALTQIVLRQKAAEKFGGDAHTLFFTPDGLEQATHRRVADHRAHRVATARSTHVVDLCCGIGADLLALSRAGCEVVGVDLDPLTAEIARANLDALSLLGAVEVADATTYPRPVNGIVYADPARRGPRGRIFDPGRFSPPWPVIEDLLTTDAVVKLAPGLPHSIVPDGVEAEWVSLDGRIREAVLWSGSLATIGRRATVLRRGHPAAELTDRDDPGRIVVRDIGRFVFEPDDAVIRAHLVTSFAAQVDGWLLDEHLAYVSADESATTPLGRTYEVLDVLPYKEKALRAALHARDIGSLTIKKRGVDVTPEALRKRLKLRGSNAATIVLTRTPRSAIAILVEPL